MTEDRHISMAITGHVDHGKSTLIGRLLYETGSLPPDKLEDLQKMAAEMGREVEFAFIVDHLKEEREKHITIDTAQIFFKTDKRRYVIIDTPGHKEFLKNMLTGASQADVAVLLVDAAEGIRDQTRRHCYVLSMLGMQQIVVAINKMDLVDYRQDRFEQLRDEVAALLKDLGIQARLILPVSAAEGDNIVKRSDKLAWFDGPTVVEALDGFENVEMEARPLRFPVQDVYDLDGRALVVGRVETGELRRGQALRVWPADAAVNVRSIEKFLADGITRAEPGDCVGLVLDAPVKRGDILAEERPGFIVSSLGAVVFWIDDEAHTAGDRLMFRCVTQETPAKITKIVKKYDPASMQVVDTNATTIGHAEVAEVEIALDRPVVLDSYSRIPELGRFVLEKADCPVAGGVVRD